MLKTIEAIEVDDFTSAVAGLSIDYVRTDVGSGACRVTSVDRGAVRLSVGSMGFSAVAATEMPADVGVFALIVRAPAGATWCGTELAAGQVYYFAPGTTFQAVEPDGLAATVLAVPSAELEAVAAASSLRLQTPSVAPLPTSEAVERLSSLLSATTVRPGSALADRWAPHVLESAAAAISTERVPNVVCVQRRLDSRTLVADAIDFVERTQTHQPTMGELCRAAAASQSRLRQAFVDVFGIPPTQYFQSRLLSRLRTDLLHADPTHDSVTTIASALGVTQLGRTAGRYQSAFGELPSETLRRHPSRRRRSLPTWSHSRSGTGSDSE